VWCYFKYQQLFAYVTHFIISIAELAEFPCVFCSEQWQKTNSDVSVSVCTSKVSMQINTDPFCLQTNQKVKYKNISVIIITNVLNVGIDPILEVYILSMSQKMDIAQHNCSVMSQPFWQTFQGSLNVHIKPFSP